ncbi:MAG TPA: hypothetical protein VMU02_01005 [bacterium]|nr:hypothetical protein [bacterium]
MNPDPPAIQRLLDQRVDAAGIYLCGPFDRSGEPSSPDIHVLAVSRRDDLRDLHFLPGIAPVPRRVEVSIVPYREMVTAVRHGAATWAQFHLLHKLRGAVPITEESDLSPLRERAREAMRTRPSFYSAVMRDFASAAREARPQGPVGPITLLNANASMLMALELRAILKAKRTFSKVSEILTDPGVTLTAEPELRVPSPARGADRMVAASRQLIAAVLRTQGVDFDRLASGESGRPGKKANDYA